jgi:hypothetical protein
MNREILTQEDMERPRCPSDLADWWWKKYEKIRSNEIEVKKARLHVGLYKYFMREMFPLSIFASWKYPDVVLVRWVSVNKEYDAEVLWGINHHQCHSIEITWPNDGKKHKEVSAALNTCGYHGGFIGDDFYNYNEDVQTRVIGGGKKKAVNDYRMTGGSTLLIVLDTTCSPLDKEKRDAQIEKLSVLLGQKSYLVDNVYLIGIPHFCICPVIEQPTRQ